MIYKHFKCIFLETSYFKFLSEFSQFFICDSFKNYESTIDIPLIRKFTHSVQATDVLNFES